MKNITIEDADLPHLYEMKSKFRDVLLTYRQFNNYQKSAEALNIPLGTMKSRTHRARVRLIELRNGRGE